MWQGKSLLMMLVLALGAPMTQAQALIRRPNTSLKLPLQPPVFGYTLTNAFGSLTFTNPSMVASPPGETNRLFILEHGGRVIVITNLASPTRSVFLDISAYIQQDYMISADEGLLGIAFHPGYATNRYFFLTFNTFITTSQGSGRHQRLVRFQASPSNPNQALPASETSLITQFDRHVIHSYNDLQFGPDGYLYVAVGDEGGYNDENNNSQRIDKNLFSGILRLDVDMRPGSLAPNPHPAVIGNYAIPPDNPFVGATSFNGSPVNPAQVRTELYAVGLRNPYRMFFDVPTGRLYCGDVGEARYEEINLIVPGANYGWAFFEGTRVSQKLDMPEPPPGFVWTRPIWEFEHGTATNQGNSAIGGVVYRGDRLTQLTGAYVFGDFEFGNIWSLRYDGVTGTVERIATDVGLAAFGLDPRNGDVLVVNHRFNTIKRLIYSTNFTGTALPPTLAATGAFTNNLINLTPHAGVVPYDLNVPFWSDNAKKTRWFSLPITNFTFTFNPTGNWSFPTGSIWIKHFELELTNGVPSSSKRLETRFLVRNTNGLYGITYRWGTSLTNATLVSHDGMDENFTVWDGGIARTQTWHYPSRNECLICHTPAGGHALGFNTAQMNRNFTYAGGTTNQIQALSSAGYFSAPVTNIHLLRALAPAADPAWSLEYRVRSYLAANCAQCHQPGGSGGGFWDARIATPLSAAGIVDGPLQNNLGDPNNRVIKPGAPSLSVLLRRISTLGQGQMPPLASRVTNTAAVALLTQWITGDLVNYQTFPQWQLAYFGSTNAPNAAPGADPDQDRASNFMEYLTSTHPLSAVAVWRISARKSNGLIQIVIPQIAHRGFEVQRSFNFLDWSALNVPSNRPFFSQTNRLSTVEEPIVIGPPRYYRVRVFEP